VIVFSLRTENRGEITLNGALSAKSRGAKHIRQVGEMSSLTSEPKIDFPAPDGGHGDIELQPLTDDGVALHLNSGRATPVDNCVVDTNPGSVVPALPAHLPILPVGHSWGDIAKITVVDRI
jgi:hypothetical protein